jgi:hypothetical protein
VTSTATNVQHGLNEQIADHARHNTKWRHFDSAQKAYEVFARINNEYFGSELPQAVIGFNDSGRLMKDGSYHYEGDGLGLQHHIDIRSDLGWLQGIVAIIHNVVHLHQETYENKKSWYHTAQFRKKLLEFGIVTNKKGDTTGLQSNFSDVLNTLGFPTLIAELEGFEPMPNVDQDDELPVCEVCGEQTCSGVHESVPGSFHQDLPPVPKPITTKKVTFNAPKSGPTLKMKKWSCPGLGHKTVNIRAAVDLSVVCVDCFTNVFGSSDSYPESMHTSMFTLQETV